MKRKYGLPELLSPAGDMECLKAAVRGGADAVYVGGKRFGARAYAANFDIEELRFAVVYCHSRGVRLYVTLNTLIFDRELSDALDFAEELERIGVDAIIAADLGVIRLIKERGLKIPIHASTQMGVHNSPGADVAYSLGCQRVVLARECSGKDIAAIVAECKPETEIFIHGAICVCHSGQCLFSSLVGGRSGNRGECAQPCRLPYNGKYPLSVSDMCLGGHIREIIRSGVSSLKIEGRMKSPEYVYGVTVIYRRLLDEGRDARSEEILELKRIFSRGDFTDGYYTERKFSGMTGVRSEEDKSKSREVKDFGEISTALQKVPVRAECCIVGGAPSTLSLSLDIRDRMSGCLATVCGEAVGAVCSDAINAPLTEDSVAARLAKMGNTPYTLNEGDIKLTLDEGVNLPPSAINALRRDGADALSARLLNRLDVILGLEDRGAPYAPAAYGSGAVVGRALVTAQFHTFDAISAAMGILDGIDISFLPVEEYARLPEHIDAQVGVYLPPVISQSELPEVRKMLSVAASLGAKYALCSNIGHFPIISEAGLAIIGDFRLNVTNSYAKEVYTTLGAAYLLLSPELTVPMARDIGGGVISLGRIPLMLTERCFIKENFGCDKCGRASITDRRGASFPILRQWGHRNLILNSMPTYMGDKRDELRRAGLGEHFVIHTPQQIQGLIKPYFDGRRLTVEHRRIGKRDAGKQ